jgi:hypothetical protein
MGASGRISEQRSPYGERHHLVECQCSECYPPEPCCRVDNFYSPDEDHAPELATTFDCIAVWHAVLVNEWEIVPGCPAING